MRLILACLMAFAAGPVCAGMPLDLPVGAELTIRKDTPLGSAELPVGPWQDGRVPTAMAEGAVSQSAWRMLAPGATTLQVLSPLREQLGAAGFQTLFECETRACGGFDFRYALPVLPEPDMHVDLGDFRVLTARKGEGAEAEYVGLWVSRSAESGFVQVVHVSPAGAEPLAVTESSKAPATADPFTDGPVANQPGTASVSGDLAADLGVQLEQTGRVALDDLVFPSGSSQLGEGDFGSLAALAAYLAEKPDRMITLVGHTDATGPIAANIALSRSRAASVADRLIARYGVRAEQVAAEGVGYLAPRASNLTEDGRTRNRRVEVTLTSTQ